ncbi:MULTISPECIES: response regulator transcription factor [Paenibacillus]|uniref:Heme response regulator HssR n=1 Tax=Paenibacillus pabuli TaxID=1472 RepID=A0A855XYL3_9BACL|nr:MULTISPECIES: response regulator transcription factor [Paenibacillus]PWW32706.1 DNA-binding response OmpR family regulator [Paenibacillus pabuli]PXV98345.1 DNA-binding response OmpR family regulator [Paenibacillus taichungensis]
MTRLIIVDDDAFIRELIAHHLKKEGFHIWEAENGEKALQILEEQMIDLVILDIMMPEMDGYELCRYLRVDRDIPILMVTAKSESAHKMKGFQLGTDDYLVKPFDPMEMVMRVKALLKRYRISMSQTIQIGNLQMDRNRLEVKVIGATNNEQISVPLKEFELLFKLASYPGQIFTREQLIEQIWGLDYTGVDRTVDVHINRLRERFSKVTDDFRLVTIRGLGYRLEVGAER